MDLAPIPLLGRHVDLVPLAREHAAGLLRAADRDTLRDLLIRPATWDEAGFADYVERILGTPGRSAFAVIERHSGDVLGTTSYFDVRAEHRGLEIGYTWIAPAQRSTHVNPEMKFLLLRNAFEALACLRVQLKTDARNSRSQRAMEKLGCVREGVLRRHMILPDGHLRDTVIYSITDEEWPRVRAALIARLGYEP